MTFRDRRPICRWSLLLLVAGWFLLALFVGETELLSVAPRAVIPGTVFGLSSILVIAFAIWLPFRRCVEGLGLRILILPHLARFVGVYFLVLHTRGVLPPEFAIPAGWGDIIVACGAIVFLFFPAARGTKWMVLAWNTAGLIDILFIVQRAAQIVLSHRHPMDVMTELPLSFLPTMVVPLIIFTHVVIFFRMARGSIGQSRNFAEAQAMVEGKPILSKPQSPQAS